MSDGIGHYCGISFVRLLKPVEYFREHYGSATWGLARLYLLLEKQRNRGQDGAGVGCIRLRAQMGQPFYHLKRAPGRNGIEEVFGAIGVGPHKGFNGRAAETEAGHETLADFTSELYLGHVRYGTDGENNDRTCHPQVRHSNWPSRTLMLVGNFNLTNSPDLFEELIGYGQHPVAVIDTMTIMEKIGHFLDRENDRLYHLHGPDGAERLTGQDLATRIGQELDLVRVLRKATRRWDGGYAIAGALGHGDSFVCRDPVGIRPCYYLQHKDYLAAASERAALVGAFETTPDEVKELPPGHCIVVKRDGRVLCEPFVEEHEIESTPTKACSFERIYFSRGNDAYIYQERKHLGRNLAKRALDAVHWEVEKTVFSFIPNTSETAFLGLISEAGRLTRVRQAEELAPRLAKGEITAEELAAAMTPKVRLEKIAHKDQKLRTFITEDADRGTLVSHVYDVTPGIVGPDDSLVVVDDSIVRGTTLRDSVISMLARLNPKRIVVVSSAPPICYPDCYGIDMSQLEKFVAFQATLALLRERGEGGAHRGCLQQVQGPARLAPRPAREPRAPPVRADQPRAVGAEDRGALAAEAIALEGRTDHSLPDDRGPARSPARAPRRLVLHRRLSHAGRVSRAEHLLPQRP